MRILLTGATGFIGRALAQALAARGHVVIPVTRSGAGGVRADFAHVPGRDFWRAHLKGVDAVVNAVGILRQSPGQAFQALHADAPAELFHACAAAGIARVVQVSALGADEQAASRYHLTKKAADDVLRSLPVASLIAQPSVVYGAGGTSAALFNKMAVSPVLPLPRGGDMPVQPVHVDDVVAAIVAWLEQPLPQGSSTVAFCGPEPLSLRGYLEALRARLGYRSPLRVLAVPEALFRAGASFAGRLPGSMLDDETAGMLLRGNAATDPAFAALLGRAPTPVAGFMDAAGAEAMRQLAVLDLWAPVLRFAVGLVWVWTGIVSAGLFPVQQSYALLARVGLAGGAATAALYGAAALDLLLGLLTWFAPARLRGAVWATQGLLVAGYTALITLFLPEYWLHPYGPLTKNLPMLAAIALLWALEPPRPRS